MVHCRAWNDPERTFDCFVRDYVHTVGLGPVYIADDCCLYKVAMPLTRKIRIKSFSEIIKWMEARGALDVHPGRVGVRLSNGDYYYLKSEQINLCGGDMCARAENYFWHKDWLEEK